MSRKKISPIIPPLCGSKEVSDILEIKKTSVPSARALRGFPEPIQILASGPIWLESEIVNYKNDKMNKKL
jgi:predicted DNA-binding transcriptional regulator AlpA